MTAASVVASVNRFSATPYRLAHLDALLTNHKPIFALYPDVFPLKYGWNRSVKCWIVFGTAAAS
jgi:hypothetical protein